MNRLFHKSQQREEARKKAIPSQVFFNHFFSISYHIQHDDKRYNLNKIDYYNKLTIKKTEFEIEQVRKLLWNSWSTEYAFSLSSLVDNSDYYKFAMHWTFPQAYYSIYLNMTAFHETQGVANEQHEKSIKVFGNSVKDNHYPKVISFYCRGLHEQFEFKGLENFKIFPNDHNVLSRINSLEEAQIQIATFLKSTRKKNAETKREKLKANKDDKFITKKGEFRKKFSQTHWNFIYRTIPETTLLNIMYRLRIKANYHDVETFMNADIDFKTFHECLSCIVDYLNFVHEGYICKVIGNEAYEKILNGFPSHLNESTAKKRYDIICGK